MKIFSGKYLLGSILLLLALNLKAQVTVVRDSSIDEALSLYKIFATEKRMVDGFRIQLGANSNRQVLMTLKAKFLQEYPDVPSYIEYQQPQFKLRVGDFRSRDEANVFLDEVRDNFSSCFVVPDKIMVEGVIW